jgi:cytochrome c-type biogenesis protein CcmH/NrfF
MKPLSRVLVWFAELATLFISYSVLCFFLPDLEIYDWYVKRYGYVLEEDFLDYYTLILFTVSIMLTTILIWIAAIVHQNVRKKHV